MQKQHPRISFSCRGSTSYFFTPAERLIVTFKFFIVGFLSLCLFLSGCLFIKESVFFASYALCRLLSAHTTSIYVVFGNNCELKNIQLTSGRHHVTYALYLRKDIEYHAQCTGIQLSDEKMDSLYATLVNFTEASSWQREAHIKEVQSKQYPIIQPDGTWACPHCGGQLVRRVAQRGSRTGQTFWGCSNYPRCHFTYQE